MPSPTVPVSMPVIVVRSGPRPCILGAKCCSKPFRWGPIVVKAVEGRFNPNLFSHRLTILMTWHHCLGRFGVAHRQFVHVGEPRKMRLFENRVSPIPSISIPYFLYCIFIYVYFYVYSCYFMMYTIMFSLKSSMAWDLPKAQRLSVASWTPPVTLPASAWWRDKNAGRKPCS